MERYSKILEKRQREIVLLRGRGCAYPACTFCDYHLDRSADDDANFALNKSVLDRVTGEFGDIGIINSGSIFELDERTQDYIRAVCRDRGIKTIHFESHWKFRDRIPELRAAYADFELKMKIGIETFDYDFREGFMRKGIPVADPAEVCRGFQEGNFLFGLAGQTVESMTYDIETALQYLERISINIMTPNTTRVKPDQGVIDAFVREIHPRYRDDWRVDILMTNTDFGVGD